MKKCLLILLFFAFCAQAYSYSQELIPGRLKQALNQACRFKEQMLYSQAVQVLLDLPQEYRTKVWQEYFGKLLLLSGDSSQAMDVLSEIEDKDWVTWVYLGLAYQDQIGRASCRERV